MNTHDMNPKLKEKNKDLDAKSKKDAVIDPLASSILTLQNTIGNQNVQKLFESKTVRREEEETRDKIAQKMEWSLLVDENNQPVIDHGCQIYISKCFNNPEETIRFAIPKKNIYAEAPYPLPSCKHALCKPYRLELEKAKPQKKKAI